MSRQRRSPWRPGPGSPGGLLLVAVLAGLFLMHGFQVTTGPDSVSGIPHPAAPSAALPMTVHGHHAEAATQAAQAGPAAQSAHTAQGDQAARAASGCGDCGGSQSGHGHRHPGGQVCLGLLALGSIIALLAAVAGRRVVPAPVLRPLTRRVRPPASRPPPRPDIYRLAVLLQ